MAFNDTNKEKRVHFVNVVKVVKDFLGEHAAPLTETDCAMLCKQKDVIDKINAALVAAGLNGLGVQLNWSEDGGATWIQYPKSRN